VEAMQVDKKPKGPASRAKRQDQKEKVLTHASPSITRQISDAIVIKEGNPFFVTLPTGDVPIQKGHAFGLYYCDCRYLSGYEFRLCGRKPAVLVSNSDRGHTAIFEVTNREIRRSGKRISKDTIGVRWQRQIDGGKLLLRDIFHLQNFGMDEIEFAVSMSFAADFEDIFIVRKLLKEKGGKKHPPQWSENTLRFIYEGKDRIFRTVKIDFWPAPDSHNETEAHFNIRLASREKKDISICIFIAESKDRTKAEKQTNTHPDAHEVVINTEPFYEKWQRTHTHIESDSLLLNHIISRSMRDLRMLRSSTEGENFFAAGIPWFGTLFGRDSLITSIQTLLFNPELAAETLRLLARYQGAKVDEWKDEQPGKILHELRVGELARTGKIPHTPYYGSVDATPLFLVLLGMYCQCTADLSIFQELKDNVDRALQWMSEYGDADRTGYIQYSSKSKQGLVNQGWKDSGNAIINRDGSLARPPIALVEVQAYAFRAKTLLADLFSRTGDATKGEQLKREADDLQARFNRDFWDERLQAYVLALQAEKTPVSVVSSNPGHALWAMIADQEKAKQTMSRLMAEDMFSGWGVRTLSENEMRYNPVGYHLGTVWPHDNSLIAAGFWNYGFDEQAAQVASGIIHSAMHFENYRMPEVFSGFNRKDYSVPVHYPVACHPQAWAAGSVPFMVMTLLGLTPNAFEKSLRIIRPRLPEFVNELTVRSLRIGDAFADVRFQRDGKRVYAKAEVLQVRGDMHIQIETSR
jgi:glycogen debranching enzyme